MQDTTLPPDLQQGPSSLSNTNNLQMAGVQDAQGSSNFQAGHSTDPRLLMDHSSLQGFKCYIDASLPPDSTNIIHRVAGLGVFLVNTDPQTPMSIYITALLLQADSVLAAEAAALALAAAVTTKLNL